MQCVSIRSEFISALAERGVSTTVLNISNLYLRYLGAPFSQQNYNLIMMRIFFPPSKLRKPRCEVPTRCWSLSRWTTRAVQSPMGTRSGDVLYSLSRHRAALCFTLSMVSLKFTPKTSPFHHCRNQWLLLAASFHLRLFFSFYFSSFTPKVGVSVSVFVHTLPPRRWESRKQRSRPFLCCPRWRCSAGPGSWRSGCGLRGRS